MKPVPVSSDDFRPSDGIFDVPAEALLMASVKGAARRAIIDRASAEDRLDELHPNFFKAVLTDVEREQWGRVNPWHLGGEFLPDRKRGELEIARISIQSTTQDVVSIYARRTSRGFAYRVVDEYSGDTLTGRTQIRRRRQLSLSELVRVFMEAWPLDEVCSGNDLAGEEAQGFCDPYSAYYPSFAEKIRAYLWAQCPAHDAEGDEEEQEEEDEGEES